MTREEYLLMLAKAGNGMNGILSEDAGRVLRLLLALDEAAAITNSPAVTAGLLDCVAEILRSAVKDFDSDEFALRLVAAGLALPAYVLNGQTDVRLWKLARAYERHVSAHSRRDR